MMQEDGTVIFEETTYEQITIEDTLSVVEKEVIEEVKGKLKLSLCVRNAYEISLLTGALMVEGFVYNVLLTEDGPDYNVIRHCWNRIDDKYFDVSKDYVWSQLPIKTSQHKYYMTGEYDHTKYPKDVVDGFFSDAIRIAGELNTKFITQMDEYLKTKNAEKESSTPKIENDEPNESTGK